MIPGDIGAEIARLLRAGTAAGELPFAATELSADGTWRPAPASIGAGARGYATSLPLSLARLTGRHATSVAEELASGLVGLPWVSAAGATGDGYLTITVTAGHLAGLAARIAAAGQAAANSDALAGRQLTASARPDLSLAASWEQAWQAQRDTLTGHMARAAGAEVLFLGSQQDLVPSSPTQAGSGSVPVSTVMSGGVAEAVAFHGADAVSYALARASAPRTDSIIRQFSLPLDMDNPFVLVRYAHADAASTLRWAGDLGLSPRQSRRHPGRRAHAARAGSPERHVLAARTRCRSSPPTPPFHARGSSGAPRAGVAQLQGVLPGAAISRHRGTRLGAGRAHRCEAVPRRRGARSDVMRSALAWYWSAGADVIGAA